MDEEQDDIQAIDSLLSRLGKAVEQADLDLIRSSYYEDATCLFTGPTGRVRGLAKILRVWERHLTEWSDVTVTRFDTVVRIHGDTAWATFKWTGEGSAKGERYRVDGERWSVVMLWDGVAWRFTQTHSSLPFSDWRALKVDS